MSEIPQYAIDWAKAYCDENGYTFVRVDPPLARATFDVAPFRGVAIICNECVGPDRCTHMHFYIPQRFSSIGVRATDDISNDL